MVRPLRIEYANAICRVTSRGNERQAIVRDDVNWQKWMQLLRRTVDEQRRRLFAFTLMTDHYHLFLQTPEANLSKGMHHLNGSFAGYFHARHATCEHLPACACRTQTGSRAASRRSWSRARGAGWR